MNIFFLLYTSFIVAIIGTIKTNNNKGSLQNFMNKKISLSSANSILMILLIQSCFFLLIVESTDNTNLNQSDRVISEPYLCNNNLCDDGNPCTLDFCQNVTIKTTNVYTKGKGRSSLPSSSKKTPQPQPEIICSHKPVQFNSSMSVTVCDDSDPCTDFDYCDNNGTCVGAKKNCDDGNSCTSDECIHGLCYNVPDLIFCNDEDDCTADDRCYDGKCKGTIADCDDKNQCTNDFCSPTKHSCVNEKLPDNTPCDDLDPCSLKDICLNGICTGEQLQCDDNNPCTVDSCGDGNGNQGCAYFFKVEGTRCNDNVACTVNDVCVIYNITNEIPGAVVTGIIDESIICRGTPMDCDDGNECTLDSCDATGGFCINDHIITEGNACNDKISCSLDDKCISGQCVGRLLDCNDYNDCTKDYCELGICHHDHELSMNSPCNDENPCTSNDVCNHLGICAGTTIDCDDENECTLDLCTSDGTCIHPPLITTINNKTDIIKCDDGIRCTTNDHCDPIDGKCKGDLITCDDSKPCTIDRCIDGKCYNDKVKIGTPCDDGDNCTIHDVCDEFSTCIGSPLKCDDGNICTYDTCNAVDGTCVYEIEIGSECDDGEACTFNDVCTTTGTCLGTFKDCTKILPSGQCRTSKCNNTLVMSTSLTSGGDGECYLVQSVEGASCNDQDACTTDDTCNHYGQCMGKQKNCNDGSVCTIDYCYQGKCFHDRKPAQTKCNDNDACTSDDKCDSLGHCTGTLKVCNDENPCTDDTCYGGACIHAHVDDGTLCDDNSGCTTNDKCINGFCVGNWICGHN